MVRATAGYQFSKVMRTLKTTGNPTLICHCYKNAALIAARSICIIDASILKKVSPDTQGKNERFYAFPSLRCNKSAVRCMTTASGMAVAGSNPLHLFQQECHARGLCDENGKRLPNVDWRIVLASTYPQNKNAAKEQQEGAEILQSVPPSLKTVWICRVSTAGIDFVVKKPGTSGDNLLAHPISMLHSQGKFLMGHSPAEQWRFEGGTVSDLPLSRKEILEQVPTFTLISLIGSHRLRKQAEQENGVNHEQDKERLNMGSNKSHLVEIMQTVRMGLEQSGNDNGISDEELNECIRPLRFLPHRVECMLARPDDSIMWDRWEWLRRTRVSDSEEDKWESPHQLVPH